MEHHRFSGIHPTTCTALHHIMNWETGHERAVSRWHNGLPPSRRGDLNHPVRIWKYFADD
jgi:hypothetical protein